jgi:hypothetical protein
MRNLAAKLPEDVWPDFKVRAQAGAEPKGFLPSSIVTRPLMGEQPTVDLVLGYHKANGSPILRKFLSKIDDAIVRVYGR